jgi:hypothetical protein
MSYDSSKLAIAWGLIPAIGMADGEVVNFDFTNDESTPYEGIRGEGDVIISPSSVFTCTVTLQEGSPTNAAWLAQYELKRTFPLTITSSLDEQKTVAFGRKARPTKRPPVTRSREMPVMVWTFTGVGGRIFITPEAL